MQFSLTKIIFTLAILLATNLTNAHQTSIKPTSIKPTPIKPTAIKPTAINKNYQLTVNQIADNVFQHISYKEIENYGMVPSNGLIVTKGTNAYIIDTPWTQADTKKLLAWIEKHGLTAISSISTHFHDDRAGGIPYLNSASIDTYASKLTNELLISKNKQAAKYNLLNSKSKFDTEGAIEVFYPGAGHSRDNIVIWLPEHKLLFGGCFVKSLNSKTLGYTGDADITQWPTSMQKLINKYPTAKQVIPGHGKTGDNKLLTHTQKLALKVSAKTKLEK